MNVDVRSEAEVVASIKLKLKQLIERDLSPGAPNRKMSEIKQSGDMVRVETWGQMFAHGIGAFLFDAVEDHGESYERLMVMLPSNHDPRGGAVGLPFRPAKPSENRPTWEFDGNRDKPTLHPSVHVHGEWHGYILAGRFETV